MLAHLGQSRGQSSQSHDEKNVHFTAMDARYEETHTFCTFSSGDRKLSPITLTFEFDLDRIKTNQQAKYLRQRLFNSEVMPKHTVL